MNNGTMRLVGTLLGLAALSSCLPTPARAHEELAEIAVGPQYDTTHVYIPSDKVDQFVSSFLATFGGKSTTQVVATVTPTPSSTSSQLLLTPAGTVSVFGFHTPIPYPFGAERTGYLVTDIDVGVRVAHAAGAALLVAPFPDPIGRDAIIQWPGGVNTQIYWHTKPPSYPPLQTFPENRVYVSPDGIAAFIRSYTAFTRGTVVSDDAQAPGIEIGRPGEIYRRVRIRSRFGFLTALVTDGHLPYPYGHELTGYAVNDLAATLAKAKTAGVSVLVAPYAAAGRYAAMVEFPGGYIAEIHDTGRK